MKDWHSKRVAEKEEEIHCLKSVLSATQRELAQRSGALDKSQCDLDNERTMASNSQKALQTANEQKASVESTLVLQDLKDN